eukprot:7268018-Karenia_brevis.AAC.1
MGHSAEWVSTHSSAVLQYLKDIGRGRHLATMGHEIDLKRFFDTFDAGHAFDGRFHSKLFYMTLVYWEEGVNPFAMMNWLEGTASGLDPISVLHAKFKSSLFDMSMRVPHTLHYAN